MANTFSPFGFRPVGRLEGSAPTAGLTRMFLLSSDTNTYFTGDVVVQSTVAGVQGYLTLPTSGNATGQAVVGVFQGCEYYSATVGRVVWNSYFPGSVGSSSPVNAYVITDPEQLFLVQGTTTAVLGSTVIGMNVGFTSTGALGIQTSGNTLSGISNVALQSTAISATATFPFRIIDTYTNFAPPGVNGTSTGSEGAQIMVVQMNNSFRRTTTAVTT